MKAYTVKVSASGTYPEYVVSMAIVDSFGTQVVKLHHEGLDGTRSIVYQTSNDEGSHFGPDAAIQWAKGLIS